MPLQHVLKECIAVQQQLEDPELDLNQLLEHAESLIHHARLAHEGATYVTTNANDRQRIRNSFARSCPPIETIQN